MRVSMAVMRVGIILSAVLLWANVQAFAFRTQTLTLPLTVINLSKGLAVGTPLGQINVQVSGRSFYLNKITDENLKFSINLQAASVGSSITVPVELTDTPDQVHVLGWEPKQIDVKVDTAITATLP